MPVFIKFFPQTYSNNIWTQTAKTKQTHWTCKTQVQTMLMISGSNRGSVVRLLQREQLTKRALLYISGHSEMTPEWGGCVARVNPYVLSNLRAARPFILAAVSETVRNVFQLVTRRISQKQMVAYSRSGSIMLWYRRRRRRCVCTDKDD